MADALCGPSNALQTFQKHTSVDRTLQQDRLVGRHSPAQGFRSSPGAHAGALDHEFEAFQAGIAGPPPQQQAFAALPPHLAHPRPPQFAPASHAPDWAADFQRLNISPGPQAAQQQRIGAPHAAASWHQEFVKQQDRVAPGPGPGFQQNTYGGMPGYGMSGFARPGFQQAGLGVMNAGSVSEVARGKQRAETAPQFDDAAFERAFADVQRQAEDEARESGWRKASGHAIGQEDASTAGRDMSSMLGQDRAEEPLETEDPAMLRLREHRPAVYATLKIRSAVDDNAAAQAMPFLDTLETMEAAHELTTDASEAKWVVDALQRIAGRDAPPEVKTRAEHLIRAINERLMSTYPLLSTPIPISQDAIWDDVEAAGYARPPALSEQEHVPPSQKQHEAAQPRPDADEMAETAGRLLDRVADNTSAKFQNSQFLALMRRLRDREVHVEGDKMVEVSSPAQSTSSPPTSTATTAQQQPQRQTHLPTTAIPPVDPHILDHAATDFAPPTYAGEEATAAVDRPTDEVSGQDSYYTVEAAYHR